jgi:hypothetical protein
MHNPNSDPNPEAGVMVTLFICAAGAVLLAGFILATLWPSIKAFFC